MIPERSSAEFVFTPSLRFRRAIAALHAAVALALIAGPFPSWVLLLLPILALSGWLNWRIAKAPVQLRNSADEWCLVPSCGAEPERLVWLASTRIGPRLTLLHAKGATRRYFWPVADDSLPADEFRRLRVWVGLATRTHQRSDS